MIRNTPLEEWEREQLEDPEFRETAEELEPAFQVALLRMRRGLTQKQLAKLVGTKQSSIARLESGKTQPSLSYLRRVVGALGARLVVQVVPEEEKAPAIREAEAQGEVSTNIAATQIAAGITVREPLTTVWGADPGAPTIRILRDGVETLLADATDEPAGEPEKPAESESE